MLQPESSYGLSPRVQSTAAPAPTLPYLPPRPKAYHPKIGLVGAGGITEYHLRAYQALELDVAVICDIDPARARARRDEFYPKAETVSDYHDIMRRDDIEIVDAAVHPEPRTRVIEAAIDTGKHVLSQKPFVLDLDLGQRLTDAAEARGVQLAVNQNGRWAPHFSYLREAVRAGLIGRLGCIDCQLAFDHSWTVGTPYEQIHHLMLLDFGIHWFDWVASLHDDLQFKSVSAQVTRTPYQRARPPFLASAILQAPELQARLTFNGAVVYDQSDVTLLTGSRGTLRSQGPSLSDQRLTLTTPGGQATPDLQGTWFENGFQGTMGELLCAIEEGREPSNSARANLRSLALCYAALGSADTNQPVRPGAVRRITP